MTCRTVRVIGKRVQEQRRSTCVFVGGWVGVCVRVRARACARQRGVKMTLTRDLEVLERVFILFFCKRVFFFCKDDTHS